MDSGVLHVNKVSGPAPEVSIYRKDRYITPLDAAVQGVVNAKFQDIRDLVSKTNAFKQFDKAAAYDDNGDPLTTLVDIALEDGAIFLSKGDKREVVYLKDLNLRPGQMTKAEGFLSELGAAISKQNGFEISTWNRLKSTTQAKINASEPPAQFAIEPGDLHVQAKKDILKCTSPKQARRYMQIMRYGAVMMHEHIAGLKLLKLRYEGEIAHTQTSAPKNKAHLAKMQNKLTKIEAKLKEIQKLDGFGLSKMALAAAKNTDRKDMATNCAEAIRQEMSAKKSGWFKKAQQPPADEVEAYAKAIAGNLHGEEGAEKSLVAALCFDPAMSWFIDHKGSCLAPLPSGIYSDLGDECEAFMYDIHVNATAIAHLAADDIKGDPSGNYDALVDQGLWRLDTIQDELLDKEYRNSDATQAGRYIGFKRGDKQILSAYNQLMKINWESYYAKNKKDDSSEGLDKLKEDFRKLLDKEIIEYTSHKEMIETDYNTCIAVRSQGGILSVPPIRTYDSSITQPQIIWGDRSDVFHYSRPDLLQKGDEYFDPVSGKKGQHDDRTIARIFGMRKGLAIEPATNASKAVEESLPPRGKLADQELDFNPVAGINGPDVDAELDTTAVDLDAPPAEELAVDNVDFGAAAGVVNADPPSRRGSVASSLDLEGVDMNGADDSNRSRRESVASSLDLQHVDVTGDDDVSESRRRGSVSSLNLQHVYLTYEDENGARHSVRAPPNSIKA